MSAAPGPPWAARATRSADPDPVTPEVRATVRARAHNRCELCGSQAGVAVHHRKLRRHGDHTVPNLVLLCAHCHSKVHSRTAWSYETGWLVRSVADPGSTPLAYGGEWLELVADGSVRRLP